MKIVLKNFHLLDGKENMEVKDNYLIEIEDEKITRIGNFEIDPNSKIIDLSGKYVLPGLINLHAHLPASGKVSNKKISDTKKLVKLICSCELFRKLGIAICAKNAKKELMSGVTTVRAVGGVSNLDSRLRDKINSGKKVGPRLLVANHAIGVPSGHMDGTVAVSAESIEDAVKMVEELSKDKVDLIKLMITGGVLDSVEPGKPARLRMMPEMVSACTKRAHELGFKVAAHVESPEGIKVAIENGVDSIEHGSYVDDTLINLLKERNGVLVLTLSPAVPLSLIDPKDTPYGEIGKINTDVVLNGMLDATKKCLDAGIPVGLGNDVGSPFVTHYNFYRELVLYTKYLGVSNAYAIYSATLLNAKILGIDGETGSVEEGKFADLMIVSNNPLDDLNNLSTPSMVIYKGKVYNNPKNKKIKSIDSILDNLIK